MDWRDHRSLVSRSCRPRRKCNIVESEPLFVSNQARELRDIAAVLRPISQHNARRIAAIDPCFIEKNNLSFLMPVYVKKNNLIIDKKEEARKSLHQQRKSAVETIYSLGAGKVQDNRRHGQETLPVIKTMDDVAEIKNR